MGGRIAWRPGFGGSISLSNRVSFVLPLAITSFERLLFVVCFNPLVHVTKIPLPWTGAGHLMRSINTICLLHIYLPTYLAIYLSIHLSIYV